MGQRIGLAWLGLLIAVAPALAQGPTAPGRQGIPNQPTRLPTSDWPGAAASNVPLSDSLRTPISTAPGTETPRPQAFATPETTRVTPSTASGGAIAVTPAIDPYTNASAPVVPTKKTPIRRSEGGLSSESSDSETAKPAAAEMLRKGAWTSGLAVILLAVFGVVVVSLLKKRNPLMGGTLPREVCDVLGRRRIDPRTSISLVRVGNRLLVLGTTADTVTSLAEIDDPVEIDQLAGLCRISEPASLPSFAAALGQAIGPKSRQREPRPKPNARAEPAPRPTRRPSGSAPADLPGLRGLKPGQKLDLTIGDQP